MTDLNGIPVRITILDGGALVEVLCRGPLGAMTFVPLTPKQIETLRDACPDDDSGDEWKEVPA